MYSLMYAYQIFPMKSVSIYSIWLKILDCKFGCKSLHFWEIPKCLYWKDALLFVKTSP